MAITMETGFGQLLRRYRLAAGLTQEELAERAGLSTRGISDLERGARGLPRKDTLQMLLQALELSSSDRTALIAAARRPATPPPGREEPGADWSLPVSPTPLVGREHELGILSALLQDPDVRLLTLTGTGGTGKTRLALAAAERSASAFPHGVHFVALAPVRDPTLVASVVAHQLGVREEAGRPLAEQIATRLAGALALLVLDNFEHLLAAAPQVAALLAACPGLKVLVTSREPLHLRGERQFAVPLLSLPNAQELTDPDALARSEAVRLFIARAQDVKADFAHTSENAPAIAEICHRLDGLPLALELAAARIKILSPAALLARLDRQLPLLTGGARDLPDRQRTFRDTISWSYDFLTPDDQRLFRRLAVFAGGCTLEAADSVANPGGQLDHFEGLTSLVDKSLVLQLEEASDEPRFRMLEVVREFGLEQLATSGEAGSVREAHATYFAGLAEELRPHIDGPHQASIVERLEAEQGNMRAALAWAIAEVNAATALRLTANLWKFWLVRSRMTEGLDWLERSLAVPGHAPPKTRIDVLYAAGSFARNQGDYSRAVTHGEEGLSLARALEHPFHTAQPLYLLGMVARYQGEIERARSLYEEALGLIREAHSPHFEAMILNSLGDVVGGHGELSTAKGHYEQALTIWRERRDKWGIGIALLNLGNLSLRTGDLARAGELLREGLELSADVGDLARIADCLDAAGRFAAAAGRWRSATRLLTAATALYTSIGIKQFPGHRRAHECALADARTALGEEAFVAARSAGQTLSPEQAVAEALQMTPAPKHAGNHQVF